MQNLLKEQRSSAKIYWFLQQKKACNGNYLTMKTPPMWFFAEVPVSEVSTVYSGMITNFCKHSL